MRPNRHQLELSRKKTRDLKGMIKRMKTTEDRVLLSLVKRLKTEDKLAVNAATLAYVQKSLFDHKIEAPLWMAAMQRKLREADEKMDKRRNVKKPKDLIKSRKENLSRATRRRLRKSLQHAAERTNKVSVAIPTYRVQ